MSKSSRLSSLLSRGHSKNDSTSSLSQSSTSSHDIPHDHASTSSSNPTQITQSSSKSKLHKNNSSASYLLPPLDVTATMALAPPPMMGAEGLMRPPSSTGPSSRPHSRQASVDGARSRPTTPSLLTPNDGSGSLSRPQTPNSHKLSKRRSWLPGVTRSDKASTDPAHLETEAWIAGLREHVAYDLGPLLRGEKITELWNEHADTLVYLFPEHTGRGPSFKVDSILFAASQSLLAMLQSSTSNGRALEDLDEEGSLAGSVRDINLEEIRTNGSGFYEEPYSNKFSEHFAGTKHIYMPLVFEGDVNSAEPQLRGDDFELIVLYRNFFAFLVGGALVATPRQVSLYPIFMGISTILKRFEFSNIDGSTYGELVSSSFTRYCDELRLADVRSSREKTIEAVVLGERMKSWPLYNEGFVHAAGKLIDMKQIESPKYAMISPVTRNRLERASLDLDGRLRTIRIKLEEFDFPSMFAGIANSQMEPEAKMVRFKSWKAAFISFRKHIIAHYRQRYGAWPPKASSKKNNFEESGLNRLVLKEMYQDFCDLYDMLVDRDALTSRTIDMQGSDRDGESDDPGESTQHALRRVESEYDRSTPPVQPPIPFDTPLIPSLSASFNRTHVLVSKSDLRERSKRLKDNEVNEILLGSYNRDSMKATPWLEDFLKFERRSGHAKSIDEIADLRCGQWLLLYAILQALPMCVVDARDLEFTEGAEYLLCMAPRGGKPWMKEDTSVSRNWYNVASGGGVVSLPADVIDHGVEGIYRRSHCWTVAATWALASIDRSPTKEMSFEPPFVLPPMIGAGSPHLSPQGSPLASPSMSPMLRPVSPALSESRLRRNANRSSVALGLQAVTPPVQQTSRPVSYVDPSRTFDSILGGSNSDVSAIDLKQEKSKKKRKQALSR